MKAIGIPIGIMDAPVRSTAEKTTDIFIGQDFTLNILSCQEFAGTFWRLNKEEHSC